MVLADLIVIDVRLLNFSQLKAWHRLSDHICNAVTYVVYCIVELNINFFICFFLSIWCRLADHICDAVCYGEGSACLAVFGAMYSDYWLCDWLATW